MALCYSWFPVNHDGVKVNHNAQYQDLDTETG